MHSSNNELLASLTAVREKTAEREQQPRICDCEALKYGCHRMLSRLSVQNACSSWCSVRHCCSSDWVAASFSCRPSCCCWLSELMPTATSASLLPYAPWPVCPADLHRCGVRHALRQHDGQVACHDAGRPGMRKALCCALKERKASMELRMLVYGLALKLALGSPVAPLSVLLLIPYPDYC